ncbi:phospholipid-binding protein MlaC [Actibacterium sp. 188UL27-1]|uniref:MlaC/ttg2D family ABC transporter substrate-binding protein n=1 Tax=Actibacterium sp. 188UL27-1 TaxID=2786961 RepID=UPI00195F0A29|nr:ABC transporter substrate-binding protein [Actibacterium sp. 188UL27-1]MBM7066018.1 ABC transporter substrate-binding protein [Actibacterium sp. 188UL27-1]
MLNNIPRRTALGLIGAATLVGPAAALTSNGAQAQVERLVADVNRVIGDGSSESAKIGKFERIFASYADTSFMAQYALGADRRRASKSQLSTFTKSFQTYISRKYGRRFREFIGGRLEVKGARKVKSVYEVQTVAYLRGQPPYNVTFQLSDRTGRPLFVNMFIEGVNLLLTERSEIGALLDRRGGDIDRLARDLRSI